LNRDPSGEMESEMDTNEAGFLQDCICKQEVLDALHTQVRNLKGNEIWALVEALLKEVLERKGDGFAFREDHRNPVIVVVNALANMAGHLLAGGGIVEDSAQEEAIERLVMRTIYEAITD